MIRRVNFGPVSASRHDGSSSELHTKAAC